MLLTICDTFNAERYIDYDKNYNEALYFIQVKNNYFSELTYTNLFSIHCDMAIYITIMLLFFRPLSQIIRDSMSIPLLLKYADSYIASHKNFGKLKLKQQLLQKGISQTIVEQKLQDENFDQSQEILKLAQKYMKNKQDNKENYIKMIKHLMNKGFEYETIKEVLKKDVD